MNSVIPQAVPTLPTPTTLTELSHVGLCGHQDERVVYKPIPVSVGGDAGVLVGVGAQIVEVGKTGLHERFSPNLEGPLHALLCKHQLPIFQAQAQQVAVGEGPIEGYSPAVSSVTFGFPRSNG